LFISFFSGIKTFFRLSFSAAQKQQQIKIISDVSGPEKVGQQFLNDPHTHSPPRFDLTTHSLPILHYIDHDRQTWAERANRWL
jgi:hypothetical protein